MTLKTLLSASLASLILLTTQAHSFEQIDKMIAQVDEDVILESELKRKVAQARGQILLRGGQLPSEEVLEKELLEQLILQSIQFQMAQRSGVKVQLAELQQIANQIAGQNGMSLSEFRLKLAEEGTPYEIFLDDLHKEVVTSRFREGYVSRRIQISEKEVDSIVQAMNAQNRIEYHLGHILLSVEENADEDTIEATKQRAIGLVQEIQAGKDFSQTAYRESSSPDSESGGDFGWKTEEDMPTLFADVVHYMEVGEVSRPIRSPSGFHILKLFQKRGEEHHLVQQNNARHILIRPDAITTDEEARSLLARVREKVIAGEADFNDEAKKHSDDPGTANLGGELGWNNVGVYDPVFEQVLGSLEKNEISEPFQSSFGWHIVQLLDRREDDQTDEMKKQQAARILQQRKFSEEVENWLREIRDEAYVQKIVVEDDA